MAEFRPTTTEPVRFGVFEINPSARELRKHGVRIKLQDKPFAVLLILLEKSGELVTREELQQRLWPADTFVEFDKGIYNAMKRLRETLGDEAETPRYIETLPRRGYRFIAPVERRNGAGERLVPVPAPTPTLRVSSAKRLALLVSLGCVLVLVGSFVLLKLRHPVLTPKVVNSAQITKDGLPKSDATIKLVSDGSTLYFQEGSLDSTEQNTALMQVSTHGGESARIPVTFRIPMALDYSPSHSELLVSAGEWSESVRPLWALLLPTGPPHRVGDILANDACWSPDGRQLVFIQGRDIFVAEADGSKVRKLASLEGFDYAFFIRFSRDGTRLRFTVGKVLHDEETEIMEMAADGTGLHRLPLHGGCCGEWSADGKYYFYRQGHDIWVLPERKNILGKVKLGTPVQLTVGPIGFGAPVPSGDGRHLFVVGLQQRIELVHYDARSRQLAGFLGGISAGELEVSRDGQWATYTTYPEGDLWRSKLDGSERLQLTFAPINAHEPRWSPDGKQILFDDFPQKLLVVSANGGTPRQLVPADHLVGAGAWLPDGNSIIFVRRSCPESSCLGVYRLDLRTQQVSKFPGSEGMISARLSRDGRYFTAGGQNKLMLYDLTSNHWSELIQGSGSVAWSRDSRSVYMSLKHESEPNELVRISIPDGKVQRVLSLKGITLGGFWPDWVSLLPDDSPLIMLNRGTEEIYRLDLQYQ
jgi:DNA-binding winged helix-turn-helix (wHTH) protein